VYASPVYTEPMKNITFSANEELIEQARAAARSQGTTLNVAVRKWLKDYSSSAGVAAESPSQPEKRSCVSNSTAPQENQEPQSVRTARANRFLAVMASLKHADLGGPYTRDELNER